MDIHVDIDGTICITKGMNYAQSVPIETRVQHINKLYDAGHHITYWTARGTKSGQYWLYRTYKQLLSWGCKFHSLKVGKPAYDLFIDDKAVNSETYFS